MKRFFSILILCHIFICVKAQTWSAVSSGMNNQINALSVYNSDLYAGGYFSVAGGNAAKNIARWNGTSWSEPSNGTDGSVAAFTSYNSDLIVGGDFYQAGGITTSSGVASMNGTTWSNVGTGMGFLCSDPQYPGTWVDGLVVYNSSLYAVGDFLTAGGNNACSIAKWDGVNWSQLGSGLNSDGSALVVYNSELYVGGDFFLLAELHQQRVLLNGMDLHGRL